MASAIQMPKLSDTMTEGTIQKWLVKEGDAVSAGDPLAEVETDKATLEMEAYVGGTILKILVGDGQTAPVGAPIAVVGKPGEDWQAVVGEAKAPSAPAAAPASAPVAAPAPAPAGKGKASAIQMPKLSDTMTEGTIQKWLVKEGDVVSAGDPLAEVETDKATLEMEAYEGGTILKILVPDGGSAKVGSAIAVVGEPGADWQAVVGAAPAPAAAAAAPAAAPTPAPTPAPAPAAPAAPAGRRYTAPQAPGEIVGVTFGFGHVVAPSVPVAPRLPSGEKVRATPVARKLAAEMGIDLSQVRGTGPGGRIVRADVEAAKTALRAVTAAAPAAPAALGGETVPMSQMRKAIARNMALANQEIPQFYLTLDVDMGAAVRLRGEMKAAGLAVSYNDFILRAVALAVRKFPRVQAQLRDDAFFVPNAVHLGVAVAVEDGLVTPVIRDADRLSLGAISRAARELATKAREKKLKPEDYQGGTITVSNLGMYEIEHFYAIVNPPQASIVSVGKVREEPVVEKGQIVVGHRMRIGYSGDHRIVNGAEGAEFLREVKRILENPMEILVG
ncbi:MAG TPA: 2-oxo acid dehydrogenase subunit E2 [Fredinandcohnia sp.]|nr:2-oxo acid dehydrogenase subunit E2 [Fredinandcohnia sp.]